MRGESREGKEEGRGGGRVEGIERRERGRKGEGGWRGKCGSEGGDGGWVVAERPNPFQNLQKLNTDEQFCCLAMQLSHSLA